MAGIDSGELAAALESLVESATRLEQLRRVTGVAFLYPLVMLVAACVLLAIVVGLVVPQFAWLNEPHFSAIAWLSRSPLAVPVLAVGVPCIVIALASAWWWRSGRLSGVSSTGLGSLAWMPGARGIRRWSQAATFSELLRLLVERGVPLDRALRLAASATDDTRLRSAAEQLADAILQGRSAQPTTAMGSVVAVDEFPLLIRLALHHAADRTLLAGGLRQAATMYRARALRAAEWYSEYAPLILTVGVGGALTIGFTLLVLWPYATTLYELAGWNWR
jgi:type II secretory pathway component PulF